MTGGLKIRGRAYMHSAAAGNSRPREAARRLYTAIDSSGIYLLTEESTEPPHWRGTPISVLQACCMLPAVTASPCTLRTGSLSVISARLSDSLRGMFLQSNVASMFRIRSQDGATVALSVSSNNMRLAHCVSPRSAMHKCEWSRLQPAATTQLQCTGVFSLHPTDDQLLPHLAHSCP